MSSRDMEDDDELVAKWLKSLPVERRLAGLTPEQRLAGLTTEQWLAGLTPEQRLAGLAPEQRLVGIDRDHQALAFPVEVLRALPDEYLSSLCPEVQDELRRRMQRSGPDVAGGVRAQASEARQTCDEAAHVVVDARRVRAARARR